MLVLRIVDGCRDISSRRHFYLSQISCINYRIKYYDLIFILFFSLTQGNLLMLYLGSHLEKGDILSDII